MSDKDRAHRALVSDVPGFRVQPQETTMPQSSKDSNGGKTHSGQKEAGKGAKPSAARKARSGSANSPTGPMKHGEKKTSP
jgi:hypothetical protein